MDRKHLPATWTSPGEPLSPLDLRIALAEYCKKAGHRAVTRSGDVVADFFVGRGRWIRRFLEEGRHVVAVDRDPRWIKTLRDDLGQTNLA